MLFTELCPNVAAVVVTLHFASFTTVTTFTLATQQAMAAICTAMHSTHCSLDTAACRLALLVTCTAMIILRSLVSSLCCSRNTERLQRRDIATRTASQADPSHILVHFYAHIQCCALLLCVTAAVAVSTSTSHH
jgi:hypothetical protein